MKKRTSKLLPCFILGIAVAGMAAQSSNAREPVTSAPQPQPKPDPKPEPKPIGAPGGVFGKTGDKAAAEPSYRTDSPSSDWEPKAEHHATTKKAAKASASASRPESASAKSEK